MTPMLAVEPALQHGRTATGSGQNGNEGVAGAASEAFDRWLHRRWGWRVNVVVDNDTASTESRPMVVMTVIE